MRKFRGRKVLAIAAAAMLATSMLGSSMTAMAATVQIDSSSATISSDKVFSLYRILNAVSSDDKKSYIYTVNDTYKDVVQKALIKVGTTETDVVTYLDSIKNNASAVRTFADALKSAVKEMDVKADGTITSSDIVDGVEFTKVVTDGYYLIVDNGGGFSDSLCQLATGTGDGANDVKTLTVKGGYPKIEKKVKENISYTEDAGYGEGYNDVADYNIGDKVPFSFYSSVPFNLDGFDAAKNQYRLIFHDKMSEGLTLNSEDIKLYIGGIEITYGYQIFGANSQVGGGDNHTFDVRIDNLCDILDKEGLKAGASIRLDFTATLNEKAIIGVPGNTNEVYLSYSNNPNDNDETKDTEADKVIVFTFETKVDKVDGEQKPLAGAEFALYKNATENADGTWSYDEADKIDVMKIGTDSENTYSVYTTPKQDINADPVTPPEKATIVSKVAADGTQVSIEIRGLDSGIYYLRETKAPRGYNQLTAPATFTIEAEYLDDRQNWDGEDAAAALTGMTVAGGDRIDNPAKYMGVAFTVINNAGSLLPETGGIGTTIFYIIGTLLMAGAVFFVVAKGRRKEENE